MVTLKRGQPVSSPTAQTEITNEGSFDINIHVYKHKPHYLLHSVRPCYLFIDWQFTRTQ